MPVKRALFLVMLSNLLFHETTNTMPIQYLTKNDNEQSMELLKRKELSVEQIVHRVGYANGNYFSKGCDLIWGYRLEISKQ